MLLRPSRSRDLLVGDVAHERVPEGVLDLAGDGASALAPNELDALEPVQTLLELPALVTEGTEPEAPADHRCVAQQLLLLAWERVEAGRDERPGPSRAGSPHRAARSACERTPLHTEGCRPRARGAAACSSASMTERPSSACTSAARLLLGERREEDRRGVDLAAAPAGSPGRVAPVARCRERATGRRWPSPRGSPRSRASPSSAQCKSSKTSTKGRSSASASRKRRHAANASPRSVSPAVASASSPASGAHVPLDPTCLRRVRDHRLHGSPELLGRLVPGRPTRGCRPGP